MYDVIKDWQESMLVLQKCSVPVIVGVHGYCIGGGIDFITSADIRYCTESAKFTIKEIDIGMYPIKLIFLGLLILELCKGLANSHQIILWQEN